MPDIVFIQETEAGYENEHKVLHVPDIGDIPLIPHEWDGETATVGTITSGAWRTWKGDRVYDVVATNGATMAWIRERNEWIAFYVNCEVDPVYGSLGEGAWGKLYRDEMVTLNGPWRLDDSHMSALLKAYGAHSIPLEEAATTSPLDLSSAGKHVN